MDILTLNKISKIGLKEFDSSYNILEECENPDGIIVRSASMHEYNFSEKTLAVARAGAGVNNIPVDRCAKEGIVVFNTPGANANAVKELVKNRLVAEDIADMLSGVLDIERLTAMGVNNR